MDPDVGQSYCFASHTSSLSFKSLLLSQVPSKDRQVLSQVQKTKLKISSPKQVISPLLIYQISQIVNDF